MNDQVTEGATKSTVKLPYDTSVSATNRKEKGKLEFSLNLKLEKKGDLNKITEFFCFEKSYFRKLLVLPSRTSMTFGFTTGVLHQHYLNSKPVQQG